jgi:hypothetical protein
LILHVSSAQIVAGIADHVAFLRAAFRFGNCVVMRCPSQPPGTSQTSRPGFVRRVATPIAMNYEQSVGNTTLNLGSSFLEWLGNQASNGFDRTFRTNPGGGGSMPAPRPRSA